MEMFKKLSAISKFALLCLFLFPGCALAGNVTLDQAKQKVLEFNSRTVNNGRYLAPISDMKNLFHVNLPSDLLSDGKEPFYIFNTDNSFYIVSSESNYGDILAYSEEGPFDVDNLAPTAKYFLDFYKKQIEVAKSIPAGSNTSEPTGYSSSKLLKTACFGQNGDFWWDECPTYYGSHCYAGCGPTAMAIVMKYYNWPKTGEGSNTVKFNGTSYTVDFSAQKYMWLDIPTDSPYYTTWSESAQKEVAKILYHCGIASNAEYGTSGTSTSILKIGPAMLNHFKYNVASNSLLGGANYWEARSLYSSESSWNDMIKKEIDNDRPCILMGESSSTAHIFVCDGYDTSGKFHFNLGWSGTCNGYYSMNSVNGEYNVTFAIVGITPDTSKGDSDEKYTCSCYFSVSDKTLKVGDTYTQSVTTDSDGSVTYSSSNTDVATVDKYGTVTAIMEGEAVITANVSETEYFEAGSASYNLTVKAAGDDDDGDEEETEHTYVDLGLPSGLLWATCNVGSSKPEDYGDFYAWGEIKTKDSYNWETYQWYERIDGKLNMTKYCTDSSRGTVDGKVTLDLEDDVAHVKWGDKWRMPTKKEMTELFEYCSCVHTEYNGIHGVIATAENGNSIFFPGSGAIMYGYPDSQYSGNCHYWTSNLYTDDNIIAYCGLVGYMNYWSTFDTRAERCYGIPVRPVYGDPQSEQEPESGITSVNTQTTSCAHKYLNNGRLIIEHGGKQYGIDGNEIR